MKCGCQGRRGEFLVELEEKDKLTLEGITVLGLGNEVRQGTWEVQRGEKQNRGWFWLHLGVLGQPAHHLTCPRYCSKPWIP